MGIKRGQFKIHFWMAIVFLGLGLFFLAAFPKKILAQDYVLGPHDVLKISVYDHEDLEARVRVSKDGKISFPLLGEVQVSGLTVIAVEQNLTRLLSDGYIIDPHISVFVEEFRVVFYVTGEVEKPGSYPFAEGITVIKAISLAGGLTDRAVERKMKVSRRDKDGEEKILIVGTNDLIKPNDVLQIPEKQWVYITGEVKSPGSYQYDAKITILKAITIAGGFTDKAAPGRTRVVRKQEDGEDVNIRVKMNDSLEPDDVIVVPESFF